MAGVTQSSILLLQVSAVVINALRWLVAVVAGAGRLSRPSTLGLEGGWTPTLVVVSAAVVNTGAGKKMEKKNSLDRLASTR